MLTSICLSVCANVYAVCSMLDDKNSYDASNQSESWFIRQNYKIMHARWLLH